MPALPRSFFVIPNPGWLRYTGRVNRLDWKFLLPILLVLTGCGEEKARVYTVPKERPGTPVAPLQPGSGATGATWKTPADWEERPASGMRVADFLINDPKGEVASVSITPMSGLRDAETEIVNMWRQEVALLPAGAEDLTSTPVRIADQQGKLFDVAGEKDRILAAVLHDGDQSWFFKMKGPASLVESQRDTFRQFLESVSFRAGAAPEPVVARPGVPGETRERPAWQAPEGWRETPPTSLGVARFVLGDQDKPEAEVTVTVFPGTAGGPLANINRWRGELGLTAWTDLGSSVQRLDQVGPEAMLIEMTGNDTRAGGQPASIIAAIVPRPNATWFYKFKGEPSLVGREKTAFVGFVQSVDYSNGF